MEQIKHHKKARKGLNKKFMKFQTPNTPNLIKITWGAILI